MPLSSTISKSLDTCSALWDIKLERSEGRKHKPSDFTYVPPFLYLPVPLVCGENDALLHVSWAAARTTQLLNYPKVAAFMKKYTSYCSCSVKSTLFANQTTKIQALFASAFSALTKF